MRRVVRIGNRIYHRRYPHCCDCWPTDCYTSDSYATPCEEYYTHAWAKRQKRP